MNFRIVDADGKPIEDILPIESVTVSQGDAITEPSLDLANSGYVLKGWSLSATEYIECVFPYHVRDNTDIYAVLMSIEAAYPGIIFNYDEKLGGYIIKGDENQPPTGDIKIPAEINGIPIVAIADDAFSNVYHEKYNGITSVDMSEAINLKSIGNDAFHFCENLTDVYLPDSVEMIGDNAFKQCNKLSNIDIQWNNLKSIGDSAFYYINVTGSLNLESVEYIGDSAFAGTNIESIIIGENITAISDILFSGCRELKHIEFKGEITSIGKNAFENTTSLNMELSFSDLTSLGEYAFTSSGITSIDLGDNLTSIPMKAFSNCQNLKEVQFPSCLEDIRTWAFENCTSLLFIELPESVSYLDTHCFRMDKNLERVIVVNSAMLEINVTIFADLDDHKYTNTTVYFPNIKSEGDGNFPPLCFVQAEVLYGVDYSGN